MSKPPIFTWQRIGSVYLMRKIEKKSQDPLPRLEIGQYNYGTLYNIRLKKSFWGLIHVKHHTKQNKCIN